MVGEGLEVKLESNLPNLDDLVDKIHSELEYFRVCLLKGNLGSGKTTLVNLLMKKRDVLDSTSSPTFSLINEYQTKEKSTIFHIDLYRINSLDEALELGITEYLSSGSICLIEWPELIEELIDGPYLEIRIDYSGNESRQYHIIKHDKARI